MQGWRYFFKKTHSLFLAVRDHVRFAQSNATLRACQLRLPSSSVINLSSSSRPAGIPSHAKQARDNRLFPRCQKGAEAFFYAFLLAGNRCFQSLVAALEIVIIHRSKGGVGFATHFLQKGIA
jgi:hypothetical protein